MMEKENLASGGGPPLKKAKLSLSLKKKQPLKVANNRLA